MVVLVPWKPVVILWLLLSALVLFGYVASSIITGGKMFVPYPAHVDRNQSAPCKAERTSGCPAPGGRGVAGRERPR
jgi:hypothetical protein